MAKLGKLSEDTVDWIDGIISETGLDNYINVKTYAGNKSKEVIKIKKAGPIEGELAKDESTVFIIVYEEAFDRLDDDMKDTLMRDAINNIVFNPDNGKVSIGACRITVTTWGIQKFGDKLLRAAESGVLAIEQIADEEKERKSQKRKKKKNKKKN